MDSGHFERVKVDMGRVLEKAWSFVKSGGGGGKFTKFAMQTSFLKICLVLFQ